MPKKAGTWPGDGVAPDAPGRAEENAERVRVGENALPPEKPRAPPRPAPGADDEENRREKRAAAAEEHEEREASGAPPAKPKL